jgi:hypothetical protein
VAADIVKTIMSQLEKIESQLAGLSSAELAAFRKWFSEFDAAAWDQQFESDVKAGRLDALADAALKVHVQAGRKSVWIEPRQSYDSV